MNFFAASLFSNPSLSLHLVYLSMSLSLYISVLLSLFLICLSVPVFLFLGLYVCYFSLVMTSIVQLIKASEYACNTGRYPVQASDMFLNDLSISLSSKRLFNHFVFSIYHSLYFSLGLDLDSRVVGTKARIAL